MTSGTYNSVTITNSIPSGAAFAVKHGTGDSCYIPAVVMFASNARPGDVVEAVLVDNPNPDACDRTPYMARYIRPVQLEMALETLVPEPEPESESEPEPEPEPTFSRAMVAARVREIMKEGGVFTTLTMFQFYLDDDGATREDNLQVYNAVSATLRKMFDNDECAKWSMWGRKSQVRASREWFSCYPQNVEVAEWEDV